MAPTRNKRIISGNYDRLSEEEKKNAVRLNSEFYIKYPLELQQNKYRISQSEDRESKSTQKRRRDTAEANLKNELTINDFQKSNEERNKFLLDGASVLSKDWRLFKYASPEMEWVKTSLNALNNVRRESLAKYISDNGIFNAEDYIKRVNMAYDEFIEAAENYCDSRNPGSIPGKRRKSQVEKLLKNARQAKNEFNSMIDAIKDNAVDFRNMSEEEKQNLTTDNIIKKIESREADENTVEWQNEGNSTDVYRMQLKGEDGNFYYLKENLPFLNQDIEGFFDRRTRQLTASKKAVNGDPDCKEEQRLQGTIDNADYDHCIALLTELKNSLNNAGGSERSRLEKRYSEYFSKNYDKMFENLKTNNSLAEFAKNHPGQSIDEQIANAKGTVKAALILRKEMLGDAAASEPPKTMSAADWVIKEMDLKPDRDSILINRLKKMNDEQVERMFRYTLGKEVELFGQMSAQQVQNASDSAAVNNTATSRIAEELGFNDVITKSKTALVKFKRRDKTVVNKLCTISEEAPGVELVDLMKTAEKEGKKIVYGPEAIRQLMRLQAIDTLCMQKDRHGRNFKCNTRTDGDVIIIDTIKAYDNDMSFDNVDLDKAFEQDNKNQFLPGDKMTLKPGTALYNYTLAKYFGVDTLTKMEDVPLPVTKIGGTKFDLLEKNGLQWVIEKQLAAKSYFKVRDYNDLVIKASTDLNNGRFHYTGSAEAKQALIDKAKTEYDGLKNIKREQYKNQDEYEHDLLVHYACYKYCDLQKKVTDLWIRTPEEQKAFVEKYKAEHDGKAPDKATAYFKMDLSEEDMAELDKTMKEMKKLDSDFNFDVLRTDITNGISMPHMFMQITMYTYANTYADNIKNRIMAQAKDPKAVNALLEPNGEIKIPAMLHYDREAYNKLKDSVAKFNDPNSYIVKQLKELGFSDEKINAIKVRNEQQLQRIEDASKQALKFYKAAGWEGKHPQCDFFLDKSDYKNFNDLSELAIDPGKTYLSVENENYLVGQKFKLKVDGKEKTVSFKDFMSAEEKKLAQDNFEAQHNDVKRWKYKPEEKKFNDISQNAVGGTNVAASKPAEYLKACQADEAYARAHVAMDKEALMQSINKSVYLDSIRCGFEKMKKPVTVEDIKSLLDPNSKGVTRYNNSLTSDAGKIYQSSMESLVDQVISQNKTHTINETYAKSIRDVSFNTAAEKIFSKLKAPNGNMQREAVVQNVADLAKDLNTLGTNFGSSLDIEKCLANFKQKNPDAISKEEEKLIKNTIKPKAAEHKVNGPQVHN